MIIVCAKGVNCRHLAQGKMQTSAINAHSPELILVFHTLKLLGELQKYISVKANVGSPAVLCYKFPIALLKREEERPME